MSDARVFRSAGVFEESKDATDLIRVLPQIFAELGLQDRYKVNWSPRTVSERQQRGRWGSNTYYHEVIFEDVRPELPPPDITVRDIAQAKARIEQREKEAALQERQEQETLAGYTAFGRTQSIAEWAKVFHTTPATVEKYKKLNDGNLEAALSQIALKKHKVA